LIEMFRKDELEEDLEILIWPTYQNIIQF